jgi:hypothetical protein
VLGAARDQVLTHVPTSAPRPPSRPPKTTSQSRPPLTFTAPLSAPAPAPRSSLIPDYITAEESEIKRKSVLKKTTEYRPGTAPAAPTPAPLTGTLTQRHVSFV